MSSKPNVQPMTYTAFHKNHREGKLGYTSQQVYLMGYSAYNPYFGTTWVFTEELSTFPRTKSTEIYQILQD